MEKIEKEKNNPIDEQPGSYEIPSNFVAESTIFWGMFKTRRAIEAGVILGAMLFIVSKTIHNTTLGISLIIIIGIPLAFLALLGINDGPFSEYIIDISNHIKRKKTILYDRTVICENTAGTIKSNENKINTNKEKGEK